MTGYVDKFNSALECGTCFSAARKLANLTQAELAANAVVSRTIISRLELGKYVSDNSIRRVLRALKDAGVEIEV